MSTLQAVPKTMSAREDFIMRSLGAKSIKGRVWEVASIQAGWTTWGEYYGPEVLAEACKLYEGLPVHAYEYGETLNHLPDEIHSFNPRGLIAHQVGIFRNVQMGEVDGIPAMVGEIHLDTDELAATLKSRMESASPPELSVDQKIQYSIDADGRIKVLKITAANSLDIVTAGAAGGKFLRAVASQAGLDRQNRSQEMEAKEIRTVDGLRQAFPELVAAAVQPVEKTLGEVRSTLSARDAEVAKLTEQNAALTKERDEAIAKLTATEKRATESEAKAKKAEHSALVERRVTESKLTKELISDTFRKQLERAETDEEIKELIADREKSLEGRAVESVDGNGRRATTPAKSTTSQVEIIDSVFGKPEATA